MARTRLEAGLCGAFCLMNLSKYSAQPEQCHRTRTKSYKKMLHSMPAQRMKKTYSKFNDTSNVGGVVPAAECHRKLK